ncbi:MAG: phenylalanine--tRNA ligase subunit alpha, partial [Solirubrobacterales bacterium]
MVDRIQQIESDGRKAVSSALSAAELEDVRVTWLGRKAELTSILRGIADLDPAERGPVGGAANQTRKTLEGLIEE